MNKKYLLAIVCILMVTGCMREPTAKNPHTGFEEEVNTIGYEELWRYETDWSSTDALYVLDLNNDGEKELVVQSALYFTLIFDKDGNVLWEKELNKVLEGVFEGSREDERSFLIVIEGRVYKDHHLYFVYPDTWEEEYISKLDNGIGPLTVLEEKMLVNERDSLLLMDFQCKKLVEFIPEEHGFDEIQKVTVHEDRYICKTYDEIILLNKNLDLLWSYEIDAHNICVTENGEEIVVLEKKKNDGKIEFYFHTLDFEGNLKSKVKCEAYTDVSRYDDVFIYNVGTLRYVNDLDNDSIEEIVLSAGVYDRDGTERWSYDIFVEHEQSHTPYEYVEDLDGDGVKEIIAISPDMLIFKSEEILLLVFDVNGNVLFNKKLFSKGEHGGKVDCFYVEDLDGDGTKEIIIAYSYEGYKIAVYGVKEP